MKKSSNTILILVIVAAVNLSHGYTIKSPETISASFSGSSASSSAFAHSSSSSYTFNGPSDPNELEKLKASVASGAAAGASTFSGAGAGALAGAGAQAGSLSGALTGFGSAAGGYSGAGAGADAASVGDISGAISGLGAGCAGGSSGCTGSDSNVIGVTNEPENTGVYKIINTNKYTTGYSGGSQEPNYQIAGQYVQSSQTAGGGCLTCKGPFPGPNGSIHDYRPASSVPAKGHSSGTTAGAGAADSAGSYQPPGTISSINTIKPSLDILPPASSGTYHETVSHGTAVNDQGLVHQGASGTGHISPNLIATFPGPSGSIYDSKPAGVVAAAGAGAGTGSYYSGSGSLVDCKYSPGSPNCGGSVVPSYSTGGHSVLPGPSGSIHDSKPAHGAGAIAGASAGTSSHIGSGSVSNIPTSHPIVGPACSYTPGSTNKNCEGTGPSSGHTTTGSLPVLPGSPGSIHDYKPAPLVPVRGGASGAAAGAGAGSYSDSGSVINIPSSQPVAGSACSYTPGSPNYCGGTVSKTEDKIIPGSSSSISPSLPGPTGSIYSSKPATFQHGAGANSGSAAGAGAGSYSDSGSVINIPSSHPVSLPACSYTPGSPNYCGGTVSKTEEKIIPGSSSSIAPNLPGPTGSIYSSKPATFQHGAGAGVNIGSVAGAGVATGSGSFSGSGSVSIPSTHPVVEPTCSYSPGSPNKCDSGNIQQNVAYSGADAGAEAGSHVLAPSIHPQLPTSHGTYYINKQTAPVKDIGAPLIHSVPSFSGQIPCSDTTCGSEILNHAAGVSIGTYSGTFDGSQNSQVVFVDKDKSDQYSNLNHDEAHQSGGIVFDNEHGSHDAVPTTSKSTYKNAPQGGFAVSTDEVDNNGFVISPGTGHLPIEADPKPFGTQGAFGGSAAIVKAAGLKNDAYFGSQGDLGLSGGLEVTPFGTQGAFGGSAAFAKGSSGVQSSSGNQLIEVRPCANGDCNTPSAGNKNDVASGDITIQKVDGSLVAIENGESHKPTCSSGACNSGIGPASGITSDSGSYTSGQVINSKDIESPIKLQCTGASCGDTEVYIIEDKPSNSRTDSASGCSSISCGGSGSGSGFATGQVLVQNGEGTTYDVTNHGASGNGGGNSFSGSNAGSYSGNQFGSGCSTGQCGSSGFGVGGSVGFDNSGGVLNKLFGSGGLSGTLNKFGENRFGGGAAYSNAGSYASAGSFASSSASAHAGSFAHSF